MGSVLAVLLMAVLVAAGAWRGERWRRKHKNDPEPETVTPTVIGVSAFTGELIAGGGPDNSLPDPPPPPECAT
jgi:hypothetical protein